MEIRSSFNPVFMKTEDEKEIEIAKKRFNALKRIVQIRKAND